MVSQKSVDKQLKNINFSLNGWNRSEIAELHNILLPDEEIYECVNGLYEGGFALLVASDVRVLLVDKKPLGFLNVEDLRFDMINEIDYNHRMVGSSITVSTGNKTLHFRSYNKVRLRKLIGHVQHCMAENKKQQSTHAEGQKQHLEQINQQLQAYLVAQYKQQQKMQEHLAALKRSDIDSADMPYIEEAEMSPKLKDFLYAQGIMETYRRHAGKEQPAEPAEAEAAEQAAEKPATAHAGSEGSENQLAEIYADGLEEVFGRQRTLPAVASEPTADESLSPGFEVNPLRVAYSRLPQALRSRKFGLSMPSLQPFRFGTPGRQQPAKR